ncbi:MAG TPA: hypothetical protein VFO38_00590 [Candidatus Saccharimonadales bacterium]|nr:hypothetical protein [Candidatus Saccharimonadales bacterium]
MLNQSLMHRVQRQLAGLAPEDIQPFVSFTIEPIYTLVARPPQNVCDAIAATAHNLKQRFPDHYYYSPDQYHMTLLPVLALKDDTIQRISQVLTPLQVTLHGISANKHGVAVAGYPTSEPSLAEMRSILRPIVGNLLDYKEHNEVWDQLLWINFMRFKTQPSHDFLTHIQSLKDLQLPTFTIASWQLYKTTSRVLAPQQSTLIDTISTSVTGQKL